MATSSANTIRTDVTEALTKVLRRGAAVATAIGGSVYLVFEKVYALPGPIIWHIITPTVNQGSAVVVSTTVTTGSGGGSGGVNTLTTNSDPDVYVHGFSCPDGHTCQQIGTALFDKTQYAINQAKIAAGEVLGKTYGGNTPNVHPGVYVNGVFHPETLAREIAEDNARAAAASATATSVSVAPNAPSVKVISENVISANATQVNIPPDASIHGTLYAANHAPAIHVAPAVTLESVSHTVSAGVPHVDVSPLILKMQGIASSFGGMLRDGAAIGHTATQNSSGLSYSFSTHLSSVFGKVGDSIQPHLGSLPFASMGAILMVGCVYSATISFYLGTKGMDARKEVEPERRVNMEALYMSS